MLVSYQPAFGVGAVFMMSGIGHDASACPFEVAAGSITDIGWMKEESGLWGLKFSDGLQARLAVACVELRLPLRQGEF